MRLLLLALAAAPFATCGQSPAAGVTWDCPDGRAFTTVVTDSNTATLRALGETRRLSRVAWPGAVRWTDSTVALTVRGDTAEVTRRDGAQLGGCVRRVIARA